MVMVVSFDLTSSFSVGIGVAYDGRMVKVSAFL